MMNPYSYSTLLMGFLLLTGFMTSVRNQHPLLHQFSIVCFWAGLWQISWTVLYNVEKLSVAVLVAKLGHVAVIFSIYSIAIFSISLLQIKNVSKVLMILRLFAGILICLLFTDLIISGVQKHYFGYYPVAGRSHFLLLIFTTAPFLVSIKGIFLNQSEENYNREHRMFSIAISISAFSCIDFLVNYGYSFFPIGFVFIGLFVFISIFAVFIGNQNKLTVLNESLESKINDAISQLQIQQQQALEAQKMATIGLIASGVAHQLGNTLNVISANSIAILGLTRKVPIEVEKIQRREESTIESVELSEFIINSLNSASKENEERQENNLHEMVESSFVLVKGKALERVALVNRVDSKIAVPCIRGSVIQIFMNLLSNSIDAISGTSGKITVNAVEELENIHITIEDNGHGIPVDIQKNIFSPFVTSKSGDKGTGLGLYVVKFELEKTGGSISFSTGPSGTTFNIALPKK